MMRGVTPRGESDETILCSLASSNGLGGWECICPATAGDSVYVCAGVFEDAGGCLSGGSGGSGGEFEGARVCFLAGEFNGAGVCGEWRATFGVRCEREILAGDWTQFVCVVVRARGEGRCAGRY